jgi:hypothetical protein
MYVRQLCRRLIPVPYLGPVEQVLGRPNARVLDIATVRPSSNTADSRERECRYDKWTDLMGSWAIEMADMFPQYVPLFERADLIGLRSWEWILCRPSLSMLILDEADIRYVPPNCE